MDNTTDDGGILERIRTLVDEEHQLRDDAPDGEGVDRTRLQRDEEELDQCWDLLRQRRARREFDADPDDAAARPPSTVENYRQ